MSIFTVEDLATGQNEYVKAFRTNYDGVNVLELNLQHSSESYKVTVNNSTSDVAILTGSGSDTIYANPTGMSFIDAGSGTNTIIGSAANMNISIEGSPNKAFTSDIITNFHAGDELTFGGGATSLYMTVRGNETIYDAFNPAVPGSAVYATFVALPSGPLNVTHSANGITLSA